MIGLSALATLVNATIWTKVQNIGLIV